VILLGRVWLQNFQVVPSDDETITQDDADRTKPQTTGVVWRTPSEGIPPSLLVIASPYDPETHYAKKRTTTWIGYKVNLTETCDADRPRLITHVATTLAPVAGGDALGSIRADLAAHDLLPNTHLVDAGYVDADLLLASTRNCAVTLFGPSPQDTQWTIASVGSLQASRLSDRLGSKDRHLSGRSLDDELEPGSQPGSHSDPHPLLQCGLQTLRAQAELYALPAPLAHAASTGGTCRAGSRAGARSR
jgi:hypothetical protein